MIFFKIVKSNFKNLLIEKYYLKYGPTSYNFLKKKTLNVIFKSLIKYSIYLKQLQMLQMCYKYYQP